MIAALVCTTEGSVLPFPSGTGPRIALTMPSVTLDRSPSGLPIASAMSPTWSLPESANRAGFRLAPLTLTTARSSGGNEPTSFAG